MAKTSSESKNEPGELNVLVLNVDFCKPDDTGL